MTTIHQRTRYNYGHVPIEVQPRVDKRNIVWKGPVANFILDQTPEIDLEGGLNSGKTTACLWKVRKSLHQSPGIWWFICRFSDGETSSLLAPKFEEVCKLFGGELPTWHPDELYYEFSNQSRAFCFGLLSPQPIRRYAKLRGLGVSGIYVDQTEEMPGDFSGELRLRLRQQGFPHQLIYSPNPLPKGSWLAKEFPESNSIKTRRYYSLSIYDNAHNLPPETIRAALLAYPPEHAKHRSVILGKRGMNVTGLPVYARMFSRALHCRPIRFDPKRPLLESFDFGKKHPCYVVAQRPYYGGLHALGGIMGAEMFLDDFLPIVKEYRNEWFGEVPARETCCDPAGSHDNSQGTRYTGVSILQGEGFRPIYRENSNAPDVRYAVMETLGKHMRRRAAGGNEAFGINNEPGHWLRVGGDEGPEEYDFLADGCEAGYVWDEHDVSVGSKKFKKAKKDGEYEHGQNCMEYLELNFGADKDTQEERDRRAQQRRQREVDARAAGGGRKRGWAS